MNISTSWQYRFRWKWPDMTKVHKIGRLVIFLQYIKKKCLFSCDAKHSDILRGSSHVCCYLLSLMLVS